MPHFICLVTFTEQGLSQLGATTKRAEAFEKRAEQLGAKVVATYWTLGQYDIVHIFEAPDDTAAAGLAFSLNLLGTVRTLTMKAFTKDEMGEVLDNILSPSDLLRVEAEAPA